MAPCILPGVGKRWFVGYAGRIWALCLAFLEIQFLGHRNTDLQCPLKGWDWKTSSSVCGTSGEVEEPLRMSSGTGCGLEEDPGTWTPSALLSFLFPPFLAVMTSHLCPTMSSCQEILS